MVLVFRCLKLFKIAQLFMSWNCNLKSCSFNLFMLHSYIESPSVKIRNKINIKQITAVTLPLWQLLQYQGGLLNEINNSPIPVSSTVDPSFQKDQYNKLKNVPLCGQGAEHGKTCYFSLLIEQPITQKAIWKSNMDKYAFVLSFNSSLK